MHRLLVTAALLVTGCGPIVAFDQPGVTVQRLGQDLKSCEVNAFEAAPPQIVQETRWRLDYRPIPVCYAGVCDFYYDRRYVPELVSVDVNARNRQARLLSCMADRGYIAAEVPRCSNPAALGATLTRGTRQAALSETSCALTLQGIGPVILDPGPG